MEDRKLENLFDAARQVKLTPEEKASSREMLRSYMALTPMRAAVAPATRARKAWGSGFAYLGKAVSVLSLVVTLTLTATGASYAAERALPGDLLYPVKVSVNEEVRAAFATTDAEKARWEAARAERRLAEAEALAEKNVLKEETRIDLETRFKKHADRASESASKIEEGEDEDEAAAITAELGGSLDAHGKIIAALVEKYGEERGNGEVVKLAATVSAQSDIVARIGLEVERKKESRIRERREREQREAALKYEEGEDEKEAEREAPANQPSETGSEPQAVTPPSDTATVVVAGEARAAAIAEANAATDARAAAKAEAGAKIRREVAVKKIAEVRAYLSKLRDKLDAEAVAEAEERLALADAAVVEGDARLAAGEHRAAVAEYLKAQRIAQESKLLIRARVNLNLRLKLNMKKEHQQAPAPAREERRIEVDAKVEAKAEEDKPEIAPETGVKTEGSFRLRHLFGR